MRISKLMLPAVTLAGALALAGCGGGSSTPTVTGDSGSRQNNNSFSHTIDCDGTPVTGTGATAAAAQAAAVCPEPAPVKAELPTGLGAEQLRDLLNLDADGDGGKDETGEIRGAASLLTTRGDPPVGTKRIVDESKNGGGMTWDKALGATLRSDLDIPRPVADLTDQIAVDDDNGTDPDLAVVASAEKGARRSVTFKGIDGVATCGTNGCAVKNEGGALKLTGDWYFTPTAADAGNRWVADGSAFKPTAWARYGYWLEESTGGDWTLRRETEAVGRTLNADSFASVPGANTATYSGDAHGVSVLTPTGAATQSGTFEADVSLTATFAGVNNTRVEGMIDDFRGDAVGSDWKLTLKSTPTGPSAGGRLAGGDVLGSAVGDTSGGRNLDGQWTAHAYGDADKRPTGFVGAFDGEFSDGTVAGVYHAD